LTVVFIGDTKFVPLNLLSKRSAESKKTINSLPYCFANKDRPKIGALRLSHIAYTMVL